MRTNNLVYIHPVRATDITVGGPGFGTFPVYRWNGKTYVEG